MRTLEVLVPALALLLAGPVLANDTPYKFRGIGLGDSPEHVQKAMPEQFPLVRAMEKSSGDFWSVGAGDREGMSRSRCPISAKGPLRDDCLKAMVVLRLVDDRIQVLQITADQSFDKPVALRAFLERLTSTYGKPDAVYLTGQDVHSDGLTERTYAWGGKTLPAKDFKMAFASYEDAERIGGQYMAMRVVLNGDAVIGYELRIADAEKSIQLHRKWQAEQKAKASRSGTAAPGSLKF
ncbi:hypothetical protein [Variovorax sp. W2I14]|uniref:hypothetical protein n=1 Tax=Variovorax sp. W2I14 TaxID=3042290 RepID=UPI003D1E9516